MMRAVKFYLAVTVAVFATMSSATSQTTPNEYSSQPYLAQIGVTPELHGTLTTYISNSTSALMPRDVGIAIFDGRSDVNHVDLKDRLSVQIVYNNGVYTKFDQHGTHVAGLAGAGLNGVGIVGVDPFAKLYSIPVFDDYGWVASDLGRAALDKAQSLGAKVVNMSYGPTSRGDVFLTGELSIFDDYLNTMVLVRAAGNSGVNAVNENYAGNAATGLANLLIVGSVDSSGNTSYFSNKPGNACFVNTTVKKGSCSNLPQNYMRNFFIVAPGQSILSDLPNNTVGTMSGTSMATPLVTGAAALVFQNAYAGNVALTPAQVVDILKKSATDLGTPGVDSTYGWGLLNVGRAISTPLGSLTVATTNKVNTSTNTLTSSKFRRSSALGNGPALSSLTNGMVVFDDYGRGFVLNHLEPSATRSTLVSDATAMLGAVLVDRDDDHQRDETRLKFFQSDTQAANYNGLSFSNETYAIATGFGSSNAYFMGLGRTNSKSQLSHRLGTQFFTGAGDIGSVFGTGYFVTADVEVADGFSIGSLYSRGSGQNIALNPDVFDLASMPTAHQSSDLVMIGGSYAINQQQRFDLSIGALNEDQSLLGIESSGAFSLGQSAKTGLVGLGYSYQIGSHFGIDAFLQAGVSRAESSQDSIFIGSSDIWSSKSGLSLTGTDIWQDKDKIQISLVSPWQIVSGTVDARIAVGREFDGTVDYETRRASLAPNSLPLDLGLSYSAHSGAMNYGVGLWFRDRDTSKLTIDETVTAAGINWQF